MFKKYDFEIGKLRAIIDEFPTEGLDAKRTEALSRILDAIEVSIGNLGYDKIDSMLKVVSDACQYSITLDYFNTNGFRDEVIKSVKDYEEKYLAANNTVSDNEILDQLLDELEITPAQAG